MAATKLPKQAQIYVVQQLAMFERPSIVKANLKQLFEIDISLPGVTQYDLSNPKLPKKWKQLFDETRAQFIADAAAIPISHKSFRLRELDSIYHKQKLSTLQNPVEMRAVLEQAAKESGNQFSNRTELTGKGGKPLIPDSQQVIVYLPDNSRGDGPDATPETPNGKPESLKKENNNAPGGESEYINTTTRRATE